MRHVSVCLAAGVAALATVFMATAGHAADSAPSGRNAWTHEGQGPGYTYANPVERSITGNNFWQLTVSEPFFPQNAGPILHGNDGVRFFCGQNNDIQARDGTTGKKIWGRRNLPGTGCRHLVVGTDRIWVVVDGHSLAKNMTDAHPHVLQLDAATGVTQWDALMTDLPASNHLNEVAGLTVSDDLVVVTSWGGPVFALEATSGAQRWQIDTCQYNTTAAIADGRVFLSGQGMSCNKRSMLAVYAATTGDMLWQRAISSGGTDQSPMVVGNRVFVSHYDDQAGQVVDAFNVATGDLEWEAPGPTWNLPLAAMGDAVFIVGGSISTSVIQARHVATGALIWQTSLRDDERVLSNLALTPAGLFFVVKPIGPWDTKLAMVSKDGRTLYNPTNIADGYQSHVSVANGRVQVVQRDAYGPLVYIYTLPDD